METLWVVTTTVLTEKTKAGIMTVEAQMCEESNGALVFRGGNNLSIKTIIAAGRWIMVEKEVKDNPNDEK